MLTLLTGPSASNRCHHKVEVMGEEAVYYTYSSTVRFKNLYLFTVEPLRDYQRKHDNSAEMQQYPEDK